MKNNTGLIRELFVTKEEVVDLKGNKHIVVSLDCEKKNHIKIKNVLSEEERVISKQAFMNWYHNGKIKANRSDELYTFRSLWKDDCRNKKTLQYARWLKLKEKILLYTSIADFNKDPFAYVEPDWLVFSKFEKWLTSYKGWENLQIRGEVVLGKKIFDIDSVILAKYQKQRIKISSERIERDELRAIKATAKWLKSVYQYDKDTIPVKDKIVYAISINDIVVYIGSGSLYRPNAHLLGNSHVDNLNILVSQGHELKYHIVYHSNEEVFARKEETDLIKHLRPIFNTVGVGYTYSNITIDNFISGLSA